jgi:hypothetical protein
MRDDFRPDRPRRTRPTGGIVQKAAGGSQDRRAGARCRESNPGPAPADRDPARRSQNSQTARAHTRAPPISRPRRISARGQPARKRKRRKADPNKAAKRAARQEREKADKRLWDAWANGAGQYPAISDLAREKGIPEPDVKHSLDRHRKRLERAGRRQPKETDK